MADKIVKEICYSESEMVNIEGNSLPGNFGKIYKAGLNIVPIGQRIARKLNELNFVSGEFDHIDINFTTVLQPDEFKVSERDVEKWLKYIDYGLLPSIFNSKTDTDKSEFIIDVTFKVLKYMYSTNAEKLETIAEVENLIHRFDTEIKIHYKTKETNTYRIDISYQIKPKGGFSKAIVEYLDKKQKFKGQAFFDLRFYDDIYPLVDTISVKDGVIILSPKKSFKAEVYNERYKMPLQIPINELDKI